MQDQKKGTGTVIHHLTYPLAVLTVCPPGVSGLRRRRCGRPAALQKLRGDTFNAGRWTRLGSPSALPRWEWPGLPGRVLPVRIGVGLARFSSRIPVWPLESCFVTPRMK